jgi:hypothetical protein
VRVSIRDVDVLRSVRPHDLAGYLRASGWSPQHTVEGKWATWVKDTYEVALPLSQDYADFAARLADLLLVLEVAEGRSQFEILADVQTTAVADVVRIRLNGPDSADGSIPIVDGAKAMSEAREMMMAAACVAAVGPRPMYHTRKPARAVEYLSRVRLGQTERGSYVITLISRVPPELKVQEALFPTTPTLQDPFERQVVRMLSTAVAETKRAAESAAAHGNFDGFQNSIHWGVSANLCEAISGLGGEGRRGVEIGFSWARSRSSDIATDITKTSFTPDVLPIIAEAARIFKATSPREEFELRGVVVKLERAEGQLTGKVTIFGFVDGEPRRVGIELADADYHRALSAHEREATVRCRGILVREGRLWWLRGVTGLEIEPDDPAEEVY